MPTKSESTSCYLDILKVMNEGNLFKVTVKLVRGFEAIVSGRKLRKYYVYTRSVL